MPLVQPHPIAPLDTTLLATVAHREQQLTPPYTSVEKRKYFLLSRHYSRGKAKLSKARVGTNKATDTHYTATLTTQLP